MVGGNDLRNPATTALNVASDIHDLALSLSGMESCHMVFVASIPPRVSYPDMCPGYLDQIEHCNLIHRYIAPTKWFCGFKVPRIVAFYDQQGLLRTYLSPGSSKRNPHPGSGKVEKQIQKLHDNLHKITTL